jgi:hypothetical protein
MTANGRRIKRWRLTDEREQAIDESFTYQSSIGGLVSCESTWPTIEWLYVTSGHVGCAMNTLIAMVKFMLVQRLKGLCCILHPTNIPIGKFLRSYASDA